MKNDQYAPFPGLGPRFGAPTEDSVFGCLTTEPMNDDILYHLNRSIADDGCCSTNPLDIDPGERLEILV